MSKVLPSESLWKESGGYYTEKPEELRRHPLLPDTQRLRDRRVFDLFRNYGNLNSDSRVLEIGCGRSMWLPYIGREFDCRVVGLDIESYAAELARANLTGAGVTGKILCRDAFDVGQNIDLLESFDLIYSMGVMEHFDDASRRLEVLARYLKSGGRILTSVPNLQGVNWFMQRFASLERLNMHVVYDIKRLADIHKQAGLKTVAAGYVGFYDGYVSATDLKTAQFRQRIHEWLSRSSNMSAEAWIRVFRDRFSPEIKWLAPHVYYIGSRSE